MSLSETSSVGPIEPRESSIPGVPECHAPFQPISPDSEMVIYRKALQRIAAYPEGPCSWLARVALHEAGQERQ